MNKRPVWQTICLLLMIFPLVSFNKISAQSDRASLRLHDDSAAFSEQTRVVPFRLKNLQEALNSTAQYASGFAIGFYDYASDTLWCIAQLVIHPVASFQELAEAVWHYDETYRFVKNYVNDVLDTYPSYSTSHRAHLHAMVLTEVAWMILPVNLSINLAAKSRRIEAFQNKIGSLVRPLLEKSLNKARSTVPFRLPQTDGWINQNLIIAAEWFASEGQPSKR